MSKLSRRFIKGILVCLLLQTGLVCPAAAAEELIYRGVTFQGQALGEMDRDNVFKIVQAENESVAVRRLSITAAGLQEPLTATYQEMGIHIDGERTWQEAYALGRSGNWWENLWKRWQLARKGAEVPLFLRVDDTALLQKLEELAQPFTQEPQNAELIIGTNNAIEIKPHALGRKADIEAAAADIKMALSAQPKQAIRVEMRFVPLEPEKTTATIEAYRITGLLSATRTVFNAGKVNRTRNIQLAAKALNNTLIAPGEVFSFNKTVGPRTKAQGYDEADIIVKNELVPGVGGGVCQVSTTLYNSALKAELQIVERTPHSMLISYVAPGMDATVVYGSRDLQFRNNTRGHLIIQTAVYQGSLEIKIFGYPLGRRVELRSTKEEEVQPKTIYKEDPAVPRGSYVLEREGSIGYIYRVERLIYDAKGVLIKREQISKDYYPPADRIIRTFAGSLLLDDSFL
ncbi:MAG: VanW family protein [Clostridia bacterium]|nr:VanW family protein [Clostridia bacterium]